MRMTTPTKLQITPGVGPGYRPDSSDLQSAANSPQEFQRLRELTDRALRDFEALRHTLDQYSLISVTDAKGVITEVNDAFCAISGYSREELIGKDHRLINSGHHGRGFWSNMWRSIVSGQPWRGEVCNRAKDGTYYWVDSIISPFANADGKITKIVSIRRDITERVRGLLALQETTHRLGLATKIAGIGVWSWDLKSGRVHWDSLMFDIYGVTPTKDSQVDYSTWASAVHPDDVAQQEALLHDAVAIEVEGAWPFAQQASARFKDIRGTICPEASHAT